MSHAAGEHAAPEGRPPVSARLLPSPSALAALTGLAVLSFFASAAPGLYEVVRQMPEQAGEFLYRIKHVSESYERAAKESQLEKA